MDVTLRSNLALQWQRAQESGLLLGAPIPVSNADAVVASGSARVTNPVIAQLEGSSSSAAAAPRHATAALKYMEGVAVNIELFFGAAGPPDFVVASSSPQGGPFTPSPANGGGASSPAMAGSPSTSSKPPIAIDYAWISSSPPLWSDDDELAIVQLLRWLRGELAHQHELRFIALARQNERLAFEHAVSLAMLGSDLTIHVADDGETATIEFPLFREKRATIFRRLENGFILYEKLTGLPLVTQGEMTSLVHGERSSVAFMYRCALRASRSTGALSVMSESVRLTTTDASASDGATTATDLLALLSMLKLCPRDLPKFGDALRDGQSLIDFIPVLEDNLNGRRVDELLHWLEMVLALQSFFGAPIELCPFPAGPDGVTTRRLAAFVVTDSTSGMTVVVVVGYEGLIATPSVEISSAHHCLGDDGEPIRIRFNFPHEIPRTVPHGSSGARATARHDVVAVAEMVNGFLESVFPKLLLICSQNAKS